MTKSAQWKVTRTSPSGEPLEWRLRPWTIEKRRSGKTLYGLWKDFRADPELWAEDFWDAVRAATLLQDKG